MDKYIDSIMKSIDKSYKNIKKSQLKSLNESITLKGKWDYTCNTKPKHGGKNHG